jgi:(p)ppGpp synthase/HD superfamily hydrolase
MYVDLDTVTRAILLATDAHRAQFRKDGVTPYITHPAAVASMVALHVQQAPLGLGYGPYEIVAAAWLHDVVEDCYPVQQDGLNVIAGILGQSVADLVKGLTNEKHDPILLRRTRKEMDWDRLAKEGLAVKLVKLFDRQHNIQDMLHPTPHFTDKFRMLYAEETLELVERIEVPGFEWLAAELREKAEAIRASAFLG